MGELRDLLLKTADPRPDATDDDGARCDAPLDAPYWTTPLEWSAVPAGPAGTPFVGYGAVTQDTLAAALQVLLGVADLPARPDEDAWFQRDAQVRRQAHDAYTSLG